VSVGELQAQNAVYCSLNFSLTDLMPLGQHVLKKGHLWKNKKTWKDSSAVNLPGHTNIHTGMPAKSKAEAAQSNILAA